MPQELSEVILNRTPSKHFVRTVLHRPYSHSVFDAVRMKCRIGVNSSFQIKNIFVWQTY